MKKFLLLATPALLAACVAHASPPTIHTCEYPILGKNGDVLYWNRDVRCGVAPQSHGEGRVMPESAPEAPLPPEEEKPPVEPPECNRECEELMEEEGV